MRLFYRQGARRRAGIVSAFIALLLVAPMTASSTAANAAGAAENAPPGVPSDIRAIFAKARYRHAIWGLRVLDGARVLVDLNSEHPFYIGSVRKIFSVGQLLNAVGPDYTYDTPVYRIGKVDARGVLHGNLVLVASGDLTMGGRTNPDGTIAISNWDHNEAESLGNAILTKPDPLAGYARLARAVKAAGIRRIAGNVLVDDRLFHAFLFRGQFYVRPIFVNDDVADVSIAPGGTPGSLAQVTTRPTSAALRIVNHVRVGASNSKDTLKIDPELPACIGSPGCTATVAGSLPDNFAPPLTGQPMLVQTVRIVQPANYARSVFVEELQAAGVAVAAPVVQNNSTASLPPPNAYRASDRVAQLVGMRYGQDAKFILKISYNIGADTSLVLLGTRNRADSMDAALAFERNDLRARWDIASSEYHFVDGSGGGETTATNAAVTKMLGELARSPAARAFVDALPILGTDGSLAFVRNFTADPSLAGAAGNVRAKTGTYVGNSPAGTPELKAQALGGYVTTKRGRHLTFALVVNSVPIQKLVDVIDVFQDQGSIAAMLWRDY